MEWFNSFSLMLFRSFILYIVVFICLQINKKFMSLRNPYNFIIYIALGSMIATSITTESSMLPTLGIIISLLFFNTLVAYLITRFPLLEKLSSSQSVVIVEDGKVKWKKLQENYITRTELREELQTQLKINDFKKIKKAYIASDGSINFITY